MTLTSRAEQEHKNRTRAQFFSSTRLLVCDEVILWMRFATDIMTLFNKLINHPINQSTNQSINQSIRLSNSLERWMSGDRFMQTDREVRHRVGFLLVLTGSKEKAPNFRATRRLAAAIAGRGFRRCRSVAGYTLGIRLWALVGQGRTVADGLVSLAEETPNAGDVWKRRRRRRNTRGWQLRRNAFVHLKYCSTACDYDSDYDDHFRENC